jgi:hypothetical protein
VDNFQDVVFALAHATGKTGRFTLIERWRNSERLLAPNEQPLKVRILNSSTGFATSAKQNLYVAKLEVHALKNERDKKDRTNLLLHNVRVIETGDG